MADWGTIGGLVGGADALQEMVAQQKQAQLMSAIMQQKQADEVLKNKIAQQEADAKTTTANAELAKAKVPTFHEPMKTTNVSGIALRRLAPTGNYDDTKTYTVVADPTNPSNVLAAYEEGAPPKAAPVAPKPEEYVSAKNGSYIGGLVPELDATGKQIQDLYTDNNGKVFHSSEIRKAPAAEAPDVVEKRGLDIKEARARLAQADAFGAGPTATGQIPDQSVHGDEYLKTLSPEIATQVKALAEGRLHPPSGMALRNPYWQQLLQAVGQYDPSFDMVNYGSRAATRKDFTSGSSANQVTAANTAIGHLATLSKAADALSNTSVPLINTIKNTLKTATGSPSVTNYNAVAPQLAKEIERLWLGTGGTLADIKGTLDTLSSSASPAQIHGAINQIGDLFESKLKALSDRYNQGMGTRDVNMITQQSRATLDALEGKGGGGAASDLGPAIGTYDPKTGKIVK